MRPGSALCDRCRLLIPIPRARGDRVFCDPEIAKHHRSCDFGQIPKDAHVARARAWNRYPSIPTIPEMGRPILLGRHRTLCPCCGIDGTLVSRPRESRTHGDRFSTDFEPITAVAEEDGRFLSPHDARCSPVNGLTSIPIERDEFRQGWAHPYPEYFPRISGGCRERQGIIPGRPRTHVHFPDGGRGGAGNADLRGTMEYAICDQHLADGAFPRQRRAGGIVNSTE